MTNLDIKKEIRYLKTFNKSIADLSDKEVFRIAKNSIIRKSKIEILKYTD